LGKTTIKILGRRLINNKEIMKTINLELSERLTIYMEDIETKYLIRKYDKKVMTWQEKDKEENFDWFVQTLTLEEAIDFLPVRIKIN
jgi:hypothetical protein